MTIQDIFDKARDYIIEHGHNKDGRYKADDGSVCLIGATAAVLGTEGLDFNHPRLRAAKAEIQYRVTVVSRRSTEYPSIIEWNDHDATLDDVLTILSDKWETMKP